MEKDERWMFLEVRKVPDKNTNVTGNWGVYRRGYATPFDTYDTKKKAVKEARRWGRKLLRKNRQIDAVNIEKYVYGISTNRDEMVRR